MTFSQYRPIQGGWQSLILTEGEATISGIEVWL